MDNKILKLLYRSYDDELDENERKKLEDTLQRSGALRNENEKILAQRKALSESPAPMFKPLFAERVMSRIETLGEKKNGIENFYETLLAVFRRLAIVGAAILLLLLIYNLQTGDALSTDEIFYASDIAIEKLIDLPFF
jgi:hypothetical protein